MPAPILIGADLVGIVAASGTATVLRQLSTPTDPALTFAISCLPQHKGNGTNYTAALRAALDLLDTAPAGYARAVYFAADGADNIEREGLDGQISRARRNHVRIYVVPIGCSQRGHSFDLARLAHMSNATGGKVKSASSMKALAHAYEGMAARGGRNLGRAVAKVLVADVSPSMDEQWDRGTKLSALQFALLRFLHIEAKRH